MNIVFFSQMDIPPNPRFPGDEVEVQKSLVTFETLRGSKGKMDPAVSAGQALSTLTYKSIIP